jgi:hypothetical protein
MIKESFDLGEYSKANMDITKPYRVEIRKI